MSDRIIIIGAGPDCIKVLNGIDCAYPALTLEGDNGLKTIQPFLVEIGVYSRSRFGAWEYKIGNADHSVMQGEEVGNRILEGTPELTWSL